MQSIYKTTEFEKVREYLSEYAISEPGALLCKTLEPSNDIQKIQSDLDVVCAASELLRLNSVPPIENFTAMKSSVEDAKRHLKLSGEEIYDFAIILQMSRRTKKFFENSGNDIFDFLKNSLFEDKIFEDKVFKMFEPTRELKKDATPELKSLNNSLDATVSNISSKISELLSNENFRADLQETIYTKRNGRTVFAVKAESKNKNGGIVHDVSATGRTYFIEPKELTELHNREAEIKSLIVAEKERIFRMLSDEISRNIAQIELSMNILAQTDFIFAKARYAAKTDAVPAKLSKERKIVIKSLKNPVLMQVCDNIVENDFEMTEENPSIIVTGSNTGGKTVILKTVGLFVVMTKAGMCIPCFEAEIYPFQKIFADIGDEQSIIQSLSTFSSHLKNLIEMTNLADKETLIMSDEICAGTDPEEGAALAKAVLRYLRKKGAFCLITTHFGELKTFALTEPGFQNASVRFDKETLKPIYLFTQGMPGSSNAVAVAENLGLAREITEDAAKMIKENDNEVLRRSEEIEALYEKTLKDREKAEKERETAEYLKLDLQSKNEELKKNKKKILEIYRKKIDGELDDVKESVRKVLKKLKSNENRVNAVDTIRKTNLLAKKFRTTLAGEADELKDKYTDIDPETLKPGDKVIIKDLNAEAVFESFASGGKKAVIMTGNVKTTVPVAKLAVFEKSALKPKSLKLRVQKSAVKFARHDVSSTLDLRGCRYEEALEKLDVYLDKACAAGLFEVTIIHGHGTGVLKSGVRKYLEHSPYVAKFRPGEGAEGGDGVVVADLNDAPAFF